MNKSVVVITERDEKHTFKSIEKAIKAKNLYGFKIKKINK
jgi:hypothetical protein